MMKNIIYYLVAKYYLKKPEQAEFIKTRCPTIKSLYHTTLNQIFYMAKSTYTPKLTSIQFEVTNKCNLKCKMCPVNNGMKRKKGLMEFTLFKKIIDENPKIDFALMSNWGEPLLHPKIFEMLEYAKKRKIRTFITTNAVLLDNDEKMKKLLMTGVERITISLDGIGDTYTKIRGFDYNIIENRIKRLIELRDEFEFETKIDINMVVMPETEEEVKRFYRKWEGIVDRVQIQPVMTFTKKKRETRCKEPWRGNLIVLWDGSVVMCCNDYDGELILGDANHNKLTEIWNGQMIKIMRGLHNEFDFPPLCNNCNEYENKYVNSRFE